MNEIENGVHEASETAAAAGPRPYSAPVLTRHGSVASLTQGGSNTAATDGVGYAS